MCGTSYYLSIELSAVCSTSLVPDLLEGGTVGPLLARIEALGDVGRVAEQLRLLLGQVLVRHGVHAAQRAQEVVRGAGVEVPANQK